MKTIGYLIFAGFYYFFHLFCSVKSKKVFAIMTHDGSASGNVGVVIDYLKARNDGYSFQFIRNEDRKDMGHSGAWKQKISFFISKPYHLATSEFVLLDNVFLPMAYLQFAKKVSIIQLWHGTGTLKRFGQDVNTGKLRKLEKNANSKVTHLIVNSMETKKEYAQSFGIEEDKVFIYGMPRTDVFFDRKKIKEKKSKFYDQYPALKDKKLILYAPTFRDQEKKEPRLALDTSFLCNNLPENYVILLRLHPFVAEAMTLDNDWKRGKEDRVIAMSSYPDVNTLLLVSDYLITDYSSVMFEYCLREKPIIFYAYDLEEFSDCGRGFYRNYEEYVPGPVVRSTGEILEFIKKQEFDPEKIHAFVQSNYRYLDGKSTERLYQHIFRQQKNH